MALAGALEHAAGMIARLDMALASHPLRPAWAWRARLDAIGRQAAVDGKAIEPWHLAALIEGVRLRLDHTPVLIDRGMLFAAAHHAFGLYRWFAVPDETQRAAIGRRGRPSRDGRHRAVAAARRGPRGPCLARSGRRAAAAARGSRAILAAASGERPALPAVDRRPALQADMPWALDAWIGHFLAALVAEAEDGLAPPRSPVARAARCCRRKAPGFACCRGGRHPGRCPLISATALGASARDGDQERDPSPRRVSSCSATSAR